MEPVNLFDVSGRVYAITGAGGALCGVMAAELAGRGARVALLDIDEAAVGERARTIRAAGGEAMPLACNVLDSDSITAAADAIAAEWGDPDVLINGAGGNHPSGSTSEAFATPELVAGEDAARTTFFDLPITGFERVFDLNFLGTVLPTRIIARRMARRGSGCVINMSSMSALTPLTKVGAYSAAKTAVASLTQWLSVHLAPVGVRVNALAPGFFMTEQLRFLHIDQQTGELTARAKAVIEHTPMKRYGEPEDLTGAVIWLSTPGSSFVTGVVLPIDGGFSSYSI
ncbi:MAG TPA: SDR family oxidoreductase [Spirochaetia bacterium]|nr:SDR family oxidoreductase [Spirochaetia bacterium]